MKKITIVSGCYNEKDNLEELYRRVKEVFKDLNEFEYEHIIIDNDSTDGSQEILRKIASSDKNIKVIINARNFGHIRSPTHALMQADGDAVILIASDMQDPPEIIPEFIKLWRAGYKIVIGIKKETEENYLIYMLRYAYYCLIWKLSDIPLVINYTGFGLYDKKVIQELKAINDPYPYLRGLICEIGFQRAEVPYTQPTRKHGITKNNYYSLYDLAMLGITNHTKIPLRLSVFTGFVMSVLSMLVAIGYLIYKLLYWNQFQPGIAPLVIGMFFLGSMQLIFLGIVGEYVGAIYTQVQKRPLVVEKERINF